MSDVTAPAIGEVRQLVHAGAAVKTPLAWFIRHEVRLFWRDWIFMLTAGKRTRERVLIAVAVVFVIGIHLFAYLMLAPWVGMGESGTGGGAIDASAKTVLVVVTSGVFLAASMMISQAMESVTRAFYARDDLDLILSSPASAVRIFAVRMTTVALSTTALTLVLAGPFINVMALIDGPGWLGAYGLIFALGAASSAFAVIASVGLFRGLGPKRARLVSQIVAAVVGAAFVIGIQAAAILSTGSPVTPSRADLTPRTADWEGGPTSCINSPVFGIPGSAIFVCSLRKPSSRRL